MKNSTSDSYDIFYNGVNRLQQKKIIYILLVHKVVYIRKRIINKIEIFYQTFLRELKQFYLEFYHKFFNYFITSHNLSSYFKFFPPKTKQRFAWFIWFLFISVVCSANHQFKWVQFLSTSLNYFRTSVIYMRYYWQTCCR